MPQLRGSRKWTGIGEDYRPASFGKLRSHHAACCPGTDNEIIRGKNFLFTSDPGSCWQSDFGNLADWRAIADLLPDTFQLSWRFRGRGVGVVVNDFQDPAEQQSVGHRAPLEKLRDELFTLEREGTGKGNPWPSPEPTPEWSLQTLEQANGSRLQVFRTSRQ
jgi:hypothetical protein